MSISLVILAIAVWVDRAWGHSAILTNPTPLKVVGVVIVIIGLGLYFWSFWTLRNWWAKDELCTMGPFKWFRHPMYAAWITFIIPAVALYLNSWIILLFAVLIHPIWHKLVTREEKMMFEIFREEYRSYSTRTGRFFPRIWNR
jgi:protein-S-isoprenylcysteine O-methyltransferase Ste14